MSLKDFLIGAGTAIVGVALGAALTFCCNNSCNQNGGNCPMKNRCENQAPYHHQRDGQRPDDYRPCQRPCVMEMAKELKLSDEQMAKVEALQKVKRESALADREKYEKDFVSILNNEQKAKYNELISAYGNENGKGFCPQGQAPEMGK